MKKMNRYLIVLLASLSLALGACTSTSDNGDYVEPDYGNNQNGNDGSGRGDGSTIGMAGPDASVSRIIFFDFDSFVVKSEFRPTVNANAQYLRANPNTKVVLAGHTDERGTSEYNLALGQKRAEAVRQAMLLLGVSERQIEAVSYGKERQAVYGSGEEVWSQNRRVEFAY